MAYTPPISTLLGAAKSIDGNIEEERGQVASVTDGQVLDTDDGGTVTLTVAGGVITAADYTGP